VSTRYGERRGEEIIEKRRKEKKREEKTKQYTFINALSPAGESQ